MREGPRGPCGVRTVMGREGRQGSGSRGSAVGRGVSWAGGVEQALVGGGAGLAAPWLGLILSLLLLL